MSDDRLVFVDTNILVYAFDGSDPVRQQAAGQVLEGLMEQDRLRLSTQVLQEFYVTMTRKVRGAWSADDALAILEDLAAWPLFSPDFAALREAVLLSRNALLSFWDALIVIAALRSGAAAIYTEDLNPGQAILGVEIVNPLASTKPQAS